MEHGGISRFMLGFVGIVSQIEVVIFHCSNHWSNWVSVFHMLNYLKLWNSDQLFNRQPPFLPIQWVVICCHMIMTQPHIIGVPASHYQPWVVSMERVTPAANAKPASKGIGEGFGTRGQEEHGERTLARPWKLEKTRKNLLVLNAGNFREWSIITDYNQSHSPISLQGGAP